MRRLRLAVWYPARDAAASRMVLGDLLTLIRDEGQFPEIAAMADAAALAQVLTGDSTALPPERAERALTLPTFARRNADPMTGPSPLVLWSSRHATVLAQAPLAEVLASHGFVVATAWSSDPPLAFLWEDRPLEEKLATIREHTVDLQFVLDRLAARPWVDRTRVVITAWSYGGQTAARLQEETDSILGVVSLDANVLPSRVEESLTLRRPLLMLIGGVTARRGLDRLGTLPLPVTLVHMSELAHGNFNAMEGYLPSILGADTVYRWSQGGEVARTGYRALADVVLMAITQLVDSSTGFTTFSESRLGQATTGLRVEIRTIPGSPSDPGTVAPGSAGNRSRETLP